MYPIARSRLGITIAIAATVVGFFEWFSAYVASVQRKARVQLLVTVMVVVGAGVLATACAAGPAPQATAAPPGAMASAPAGGATPASASRAVSGHPPIAVHPENPRYFLFRGQPTVLVTSAEHYGAVLNADFDYLPYLDELQARGLNLTRTFAGPYREETGISQLPDNSLAPRRPASYVAPWARTSEGGAADGGAKFDLAAWDPAYFERLKAFVAEAGRRGIVVELTFFSAMYFDHRWRLSPLHAGNNVNGVGHVAYTEAHTLAEPALVEVHEKLVAKVAQELRGADNLYYEIINEPYAKPGPAGGLAFDTLATPASLQWQDRMIDALVAAEAPFEHKHLIAQNLSGEAVEVPEPNPHVSVLNFHYGSSESARLNARWRRPVVLDETGGLGTADAPYRRQAWAFILAGGGGFNHLDLTFTTDREDGTYHPLPPDALGGGGPSLRAQLGILKDFIHGFDVVAMAPDHAVVRGGVPEGAQTYVLSQPGHAYAIYLDGGSRATLTLELPPGAYRAEWVDTKTGAVARADSVAGGTGTLASPPYVDDIALRLRRVATPP